MLKHLNLVEMVGLLRPLVKKTRRRQTFLSIPEVAPLHGKVRAAYEAVLAVQPVKTEVPPEVRRIVAEQAKVDNTHDHLARYIRLSLEAHREYCLAQDPPDLERAAQCDQIDAKLYPSGMEIVNASYLAEFGNTERIDKLMSEEPGIGDFLKTVPAPGKKSLHDIVQRWIGTGRELADLEHDREEHVAAQETKPVTQSSIQAARSQWFEVVRTILANLKLSDAPAQSIAEIRGPIERASDRAGKRYPSGKTAEPVLETDELDVEEDEAPAGGSRDEG